MLRLTSFARPAGLAAASLALTLFSAAPAVSVAPPLSDPHVLAHLDLAAGQMPENIVLEPDGSADVTFISARQIARIGLDGHTEILGTLPAPAVPATPVVGFAAVAGIARADDGTLYVNYATGTDDLTGVWRLTPGGVPERIAALPANGLPNGLTLDQQHGDLYVADAVLGTVWRVSLQDGTRTAWATGTELQPTGFLGANGIRSHHGAIWVSNTDRGTVLRIPICPDGSAGPIETRVTGIEGIDDFGFTGHGDTLLAARNAANEVVYVTPGGGAPTVVLTQQDGLSNPTSVALCGGAVYVTSAAFLTLQDPNVLLARIDA